MLECYFDDSSDDRREKYRASGGLIGNTDQWDAFEMAWSHATHALKEPFHSTDCECGHGQFADWSKQQRDELIKRLVTIIKGIRFAGFASIVPVRVYREAFPDCREDDAYLLTIPHAIMNVAFIAHGSKADVDVWFESGSKNGAIRNHFDSIKSLAWEPAKRLRRISFDSKWLRPLQSADFVAREAFKHVDNLGKRPIRKPMRRLGERLYFIAWNEEALKHLAMNGGPRNLEFLARWDRQTGAPLLAHHSLWRQH